MLFKYESCIVISLQPDPLMEALESLESFVGDSSSLDGRVETRQADFEVLYSLSLLLII